MEILIKALQLIFSLSILVVFHELGHFTFAKIFKTRVEKFYLFFNPWFSIFKFKKGDTEYGLGWLPLGGYVKISGMIDESMDKEQMKLPAEPWEFRSKPGWQRLLIMIGGVLVNFLLAGAIYIAILFTWGEDYLPTKNVTYGISTDSVGVAIGLQNGDKILTVNNKEVENFDKILHEILLSDEKSIQIERNGEKKEVVISNSQVATLLKHKKSIIRYRFPFEIAEVTKKTNAEKAGFQVNDRFVGADSTKIEFFDEFQTYFLSHSGKQITIKALRNNDTVSVPVLVSDKGVIGVKVKTAEFFKLEHVDYSLVQAIPGGIKKGFIETGNYLKQFKLIFNPETEAYKQVGSFIAIGNLFPPTWDWQSLWVLTALLSIMLGVVNLLPIPALDGGHVMFLLYEMITRRKPGDKFMEYAQIAGMVLLLGLMVFALRNDIINFF